MNEQKNFLEVLKEELGAMQEEGLISKEQLEKGITVPFRSLYFKYLDGRILSFTLANILKQENPEYVQATNSLGYNPHSISEFKIKQSGEGIELCVLGRDKKTTFSVTNEKRDNEASLQITPEELFQRYCETKNKEQLFQLRKKFLLTRDNMDIIKGLISNPKDDAIYVNGLNTPFNEMMKNFIEYCRYYLVEMPEVDIGPKVIQGGIIEQEVGERVISNSSKQTRRSASSKQRTSEIYPFEERRKILDELDPKMIISFDTMGEDGKVMPGVYNTFIYENPQNRGGHLLISEPFKGDSATRCTYISDKRLNDFLLDGQQLSDDVWRDIARYYVECSLSAFSLEPYSYKITHRGSIEDQSKKIRELLDSDMSINLVKVSSRIALSVYNNIKKINSGNYIETIREGLKNGDIDENTINRMSTIMKNALGLNKEHDENSKEKGEKL